MAIVDHPGFPCWNRRHQLTPPPTAIAIIRRTNSPDSPLEPRCQPCVVQLAAAEADYVVAFLDPTRQRGPVAYGTDDAGGVWDIYDPSVLDDRPRPDPAP